MRRTAARDRRTRSVGLSDPDVCHGARRPRYACEKSRGGVPDPGPAPEQNRRQAAVTSTGARAGEGRHDRAARCPPPAGHVSWPEPSSDRWLEVVAEGTPPVQDTFMTTTRWPLLNFSCAVTAGPRITPAA